MDLIFGLQTCNLLNLLRYCDNLACLYLFINVSAGYQQVIDRFEPNFVE